MQCSGLGSSNRTDRSTECLVFCDGKALSGINDRRDEINRYRKTVVRSYIACIIRSRNSDAMRTVDARAAAIYIGNHEAISAVGIVCEGSRSAKAAIDPGEVCGNRESCFAKINCDGKAFAIGISTIAACRDADKYRDRSVFHGSVVCSTCSGITCSIGKGDRKGQVAVGQTADVNACDLIGSSGDSARARDRSGATIRSDAVGIIRSYFRGSESKAGSRLIGVVIESIVH